LKQKLEKTILILTLFLVISFGQVARILGTTDIRLVDFIQIFCTGGVTLILVVELIKAAKTKE
jgi:hypothetical protein